MGARNGERYEVRVLTRRLVKGQNVICAYAQPATGAAPRPTVFIDRGGCLFTPADLSERTFRRWQKDLCGPDWVEPTTTPMPPS